MRSRKPKPSNRPLVMPMVGATENPQVQLGDHPLFPIGLIFQGLVFGSQAPATIQVALQRDQAAPLLFALAELRAAGVIPEPAVDIEVRRLQ